MKTVLIEMQYAGPLEYYARLMEYRNVLFERHENFVKSTYRNRCYIAGPNGKLRLSIPVKRGKRQRSLYTDIEISYEENWSNIHWQSLCSCYRKSPYFEFYEDRFTPFYHTQHQYLFDFNRQLMELILELLGINLVISFTESYSHKAPEHVVDYRSAIHPNGQKSISTYKSPQYCQVFEEKTGFLPNLSILDLLFNEGPNSKNFLTQTPIE